MDFAGIFDKNFFSFAGMLGGAPGGGLLPLGGASLAAASGQPHAGENYALLASGACADDRREGRALLRGARRGVRDAVAAADAALDSAHACRRRRTR